MKLTWAQLREEVKYTAKQIGFNLIWIPWTTAVIYWLSGWTPVSSETIVALSSISLAIMFSLVFSGAIFREKLLGIHELLLSLPFSPTHLLLLKTLAGFVIEVTGILLGSLIGLLLADYSGIHIPLTVMVSGLLISTPLLFTFTFFVILTTLLFSSTWFNAVKIAIGFVAFFVPLYVPRYFGNVLSLKLALMLSLVISVGISIPSLLIIKSLGDHLAERTLLV
jgi:ABC-type Na+ efflux pump permease subunit